MRKNILFVAQSTKKWLGGVYYIKNQIAQLLSYAPARKRLKIYLYTSEKCGKEYADLLNYHNVKMIFCEKISTNLLVQLGETINENLDADILYLTLRYNISYVFPYFPKGKINKHFLLGKSISWIPDFQHIHLTYLFSKNELKKREEDFGEMAREHNKLVLSSQDAYKDYINKYPECKERVYVIPFCSALDKEAVKRNDVEKVKKKYGIEGSYFIICNQFWQHKNHMLAFQALKNALEIDPQIMMVCTGNTEDYRNKKYIREIKEFIKNNGLQNNIFLLGLVDKNDQIQLLKGALALIQPSLFEGWGTGVEDAKTLKKRILLSNIAVHREQMDKTAQLFDPYVSDELTGLMLELWNQDREKLQNSGYSRKDASKYGALFYKMLFD